MGDQFRAAVTVTEMAKMVGLSRARFYELVREGTFPMPSSCVRSRRPLYVRNQQERCLEVKRTGRGIDGRLVIFYARRPKVCSSVRAKKSVTARHEAILAGVRGLGLSTATAAQVDQAVRAVFPNGSTGDAEGEMLRTVFLYLVKQGRATA